MPPPHHHHTTHTFRPQSLCQQRSLEDRTAGNLKRTDCSSKTLRVPTCDSQDLDAEVGESEVVDAKGAVALCDSGWLAVLFNDAFVS